MINCIKYFLIFFIACNSHVQAQPNIEAKTAILIDYHTGKILYDLESDMSIWPASMTKIMTAIVAFNY